MQTDNIIKQNSFHVEEDFYEEIINGLQAAKDREQARKKKQPIVILPRQARFITYVTSPIILKEARHLIESVTRFEYHKERALAASGLRAKFLKAWSKFSDVDEEADDEIKAINKKGFSIFKVVKVFRTFKTVARIYSAIKLYKKPDTSPISVDLRRLNSPEQMSNFDSLLTIQLEAQKEPLIQVLQGFMYPICKEMFTLYDQKLEEMYYGFWKWCVKNFIFDPESALDWVMLVISGAAAIIAAYVATPTTPYGQAAAASGVFQAIQGLRISVKAAKAWRVLSRAFRGFTGIAKVSRMAANGRKITRVKAASHVFTTTRRRLGIGYAVFSGLDFIHVSNQDVIDYYTKFKRFGRIAGSRVEAKFTDDIGRMFDMAMDTVDSTVSLFEGEEGTFVPSLEEKDLSRKVNEQFNVNIKIEGLNDSIIFKTLNALDKAFRIVYPNLFKNIINSLGYVFSLDFKDPYNFSYEEKIVQIFSNCVSLSGFSQMKTVKFFPQISSDKKYGQIEIHDLNGGIKVKIIDNNSKREQDINRKNNGLSVDRGSFRRVYKKGIANGFILKFKNYNNKSWKKKFIHEGVLHDFTPSGGIKGTLNELGDDGIEWKIDNYNHDYVEALQNIVNHENKKIELEKNTAKTVDMIIVSFQNAYAPRPNNTRKTFVIPQPERQPRTLLDMISQAPAGMTY